MYVLKLENRVDEFKLANEGFRVDLAKIRMPKYFALFFLNWLKFIFENTTQTSDWRYIISKVKLGEILFLTY
jgi:hypothetical protein